ncbi:hypothetical protein [Deinococcus sp.]|uniref:hypothetical protein n=1 Tax=Deinococcus sp. TaxID=47478 RepID=UPI0025F379C4|nr:hypothetical protein [Deinococcus sp.]
MKLNLRTARKTVFFEVFVLFLNLSSVSAQQGERCGPNSDVKVQAYNGLEVVVKFPKEEQSDTGGCLYGWYVALNEESPDGKSTLIHFYSNNTKAWMSEAYVVRHDASVLHLKNDGVKFIAWVPNSQYVIGFGNNTLRLWNLSGGLKTVVADGVNKVKYTDAKVCLEYIRFRSLNNEAEMEVFVDDYAIPRLKKLGTRRVLPVSGAYDYDCVSE